MTDPPVRILLLASDDHDRRDLTDAIRKHHATAGIDAYADFSQVMQDGLPADPPRLVILSAGYTQAWSLDEFAELWNELPLARWIIVQSGWSDSAIRHWPWLPPACCVPRERLEIRLRQELDVLDNRREPLPLTASLEETFLRDAELSEDYDLSGMTVGLYTPDRDLRRFWTDLITAYGGEIVSLEQEPQALLWDCDPWQKDRIRQLEIFRRREPQCHVIGLRNIVHDLAESLAREAGVDVLLPKNLSAALVLESLSVMQI
ncbi:MAG: hypothetical protein HUJ26_20505 [Planctomycetaceae bacterium]|nr:hypothetical protein [Planctomycetaceae bacterium]